VTDLSKVELRRKLDIRRETYRGLHCEQGQDLQQMVLDDITDDAILVKVAATPLCAKVLTEDDLHVADEAAIPQWLKDQVGEPQHLHTTVDLGEFPGAE